MQLSTIKKLPHSVVEIETTVLQKNISEEYEKVLKKVVADAEIQGFRKGKAPREQVLKNVDQAKIANIIVQNLIPNVYADVLKEHSIHPVVDPKLYIDEPQNLEEILSKKSDLKVRFEIAERPKIDLKDYKEKLKSESAKSKIWTPEKGEVEDKKNEESEEMKDQKKFVSIVDVLLKTCEVDLSEIIIEAETNQSLSQTLSEIKKLGLTLEEYLKNTGKTVETLKKEAEEKATNSLKLSFIFDEISKSENLSVEKTEIDKIIAEIKDPSQRSEAEKNAYQIAPIILRQKVIDFLMKL